VRDERSERFEASTWRSAAWFAGWAGPPTDGGLVRSPTLDPAGSGVGGGSPVNADHMATTSVTVRAIGPTVSNVGTGEDALGRDAPPARLEPDDAAAGCG